jgi:predicted tellurium resistance membrane protein TerC
VLGIDNVIFISNLAEKLPVEQRVKLRYPGIGLAVVLHLIFLGSISWILTLDTTLFPIGNHSFTGKAIILLLGGLFLMYKSTKEIYPQTEHQKKEPGESKSTFQQLLIEVLLRDIVFSIDYIITAAGMVIDIWMMYTAVLVSVSLMLLFSGNIHTFISLHPSFNPNLSIEIVTRGESSRISSVPARRIYEEEIVTPILTNKFEETLEMEEISLRSRFSID